MFTAYYQLAEITAKQLLKALRKQKNRLLLSFAAVAFSAGAYAAQPRAPPQQPVHEQARSQTQSHTIEHVVQAGERCETIVQNYAAVNPALFSYELRTPQAVQRAVNETAQRSASRTDISGRAQTYLLEDRVRAHGVRGQDGETCDVLYPGTTLAFDYQSTTSNTAQQPVLSEQQPTEKPSSAGLIAIPIAVAGLGAGAALYGASGKPKSKTREAFCDETKQEQQASRHYKRADAQAYRNERNNLANDMRRAGVRVTDIANVLGVSRSTVYRTSNVN